MPRKMRLAAVARIPTRVSEETLVAFNCGGVGEMISENENGFLIEPGNINSFIKKTEELLKNNFNKESISKKAQEIYSPQLAAKKYSELYR